MAPKKALPPPSHEPEEEEETSEEESGESEEGTGGESEVEEKEEHKEKTTQIQPSQVNKKPSVQKQTTPPTASPQSEEEEEGEGEEGEEPDSPPSPNVSDFTVKPISPTKLASKNAKPTPIPTPKRTSDAQKDDEKDPRNRKKMKTNEGKEKKEKAYAVSASGGVGRVWSEEDEIAVLEGMIDYRNRKGSDPSDDMGAFHEFIKGKLHADMSKTQLYEKVRRFKKKFFTNVEKAKSGNDPVFSKSHEHKAFDLSKKIWGSGHDDGKVKRGGKIGSISGIVKEGEEMGVANGIVKEGDDVVMDDVGNDEGDFQSKYPHLSQSFDLDWSFVPNGGRSVLEENLSLIDGVKARELEEKWKKLREQEAELLLRRMTLMTEQTKLVLNARKKI